MPRRRLMLVDQADTVRLALFGETCGWRAVGRPEDGADAAVWRTPFGGLVTLSRDELLDRPVVQLDAEDAAADGEASGLAERLPEIVPAVRFEDALAAFDGAGTAGGDWALPLLAATLPEDDTANRARVLRAAAEALSDVAGERRAGGVLAAAYLDDPVLLAGVRALALADPDPRVRSPARRVAGSAPAAAARRIAFVAERVADEFVPFAAEQGWELTAHRPGGPDESERVTWRAEPGVEIVLTSDIRLGRESLTFAAADPAAYRAVDEVESLVRARFATVDLDETLGLLAREPDGAGRLLPLTVAAAAAPTSYLPHFLAVVAELLGSPLTPLRGFATGAVIYFPWPEVVPFLAWSARHDPEPTIRGIARVGLEAVDRAYGDRLGALLPPVTYYAAATGGRELRRRIGVVPAPIVQRLGGDLLWHAAPPGGLSTAYREVSLDEAAAIARRAQSDSPTDV